MSACGLKSNIALPLPSSSHRFFHIFLAYFLFYFPVLDFRERIGWLELLLLFRADLVLVALALA